MAKIPFTIHAHYIFELIERQAQSPVHAFVELIMNSVDAGATAVKINMQSIVEGARKSVTFKVEDDGKGFTQKSIKEYFASFGNPHEKGDAIFAQHRLGRGTLFYYAETTWRSNTFEMGVDLVSAIKNKDIEGVGFEFKRGCKKVDGCIIEGSFYKEHDETYLEQIDDIELFKKELSKAIRYLKVPVLFNGKIINQTNYSKIDTKYCQLIETETATYIIDSRKRELKVYNQGVHVKYAILAEALLGGVVITKQNMTLNITRNEPSSDCFVWSQIQKDYKVEIEPDLLKKRADILDIYKRKTPWETFQSLIGGKIRFDIHYSAELLEFIVNYKFMKALNGETLSIKDLYAHSPRVSTFFEYESDTVIGEKIQRVESVRLIQEDFQYMLISSIADSEFEFTQDQDFGCPLFKVFNQLIDEWIQAAKPEFTKIADKVIFIDVDYEDDKYKSIQKRLSDKDLNPEQITYLSALRLINEHLFNAISKKLPGTALHPIYLGTSESYRAWNNTDKKHICFDVSTQKLFESKLWMQLISIMIHEYCHCQELAHDFDFYELFHNIHMHLDLYPILKQLESFHEQHCQAA